MSHLSNLIADPKLLVARMRVGTTEPEELRRTVARIEQNGSIGAGEMEDVGELQQRIAQVGQRNSSV